MEISLCASYVDDFALLPQSEIYTAKTDGTVEVHEKTLQRFLELLTGRVGPTFSGQHLLPFLPEFSDVSRSIRVLQLYYDMEQFRDVDLSQHLLDLAAIVQKMYTHIVESKPDYLLYALGASYVYEFEECPLGRAFVSAKIADDKGVTVVFSGTSRAAPVLYTVCTAMYKLTKGLQQTGYYRFVPADSCNPPPHTRLALPTYCRYTGYMYKDPKIGICKRWMCTDDHVMVIMRPDAAQNTNTSFCTSHLDDLATRQFYKPLDNADAARAFCSFSDNVAYTYYAHNFDRRCTGFVKCAGLTPVVPDLRLYESLHLPHTFYDKARLRQIVNGYRGKESLVIVFHGPSGCGKKTAALAIAAALALPVQCTTPSEICAEMLEDCAAWKAIILVPDVPARRQSDKENYQCLGLYGNVIIVTCENLENLGTLALRAQITLQFSDLRNDIVGRRAVWQYLLPGADAGKLAVHNLCAHEINSMVTVAKSLGTTEVADIEAMIAAQKQQYMGIYS